MGFEVQYILTPDGGNPVVIKSDATEAFPAADPAGLSNTRLLKAGKTHKITAKMQLTNAGIAKVGANNEARFEAADTTRNLVVVARSIKITPRENGHPDKGKAD